MLYEVITGLSLEETGLSPDYLELEITESVMMEEANYIVEKLNLLKNMRNNFV